MAFNKTVFELKFVETLAAIAGAERVTKESLKTLSRDIIEAWHATGNVEYANKLLAVLTPINKKTFIAFGKHFAGYSYDETLGAFTKKSKKRYDEAHKRAMEFLQDPNQNIWTWADRHIQVEHKEALDFDAIKKYFVGKLTKAKAIENGERQLLKAILSSGIHASVIAEVLAEVEFEDDEQPVEQSPM